MNKEDGIVHDKPKIAVGVDMKLNVGNYESIGGSIIVSGLRVGATPDDVVRLMETGEMAFDLLRQELAGKLDEARAEWQNKATRSTQQ